MRNDSGSTVLALVLALLMASPALAQQMDEQIAAESADSQTEAPKTKEPKTEDLLAPGQEGLLVDSESADGEGDPPPEPEAVVKTKTKSNQSND